MAANQDEPKPQPSDQTPIARPGDQSSKDDAGSDYQEILENTASRVAQIRSQANFTQVRLTEEQFSGVIELQGKELDYADRQSQREHDAGKETRRWAVLVVIIAILAVVGIIVFLTIYKESGLLGYILSGIGGLIAGAFGGYGYANRSR